MSSKLTLFCKLDCDITDSEQEENMYPDVPVFVEYESLLKHGSLLRAHGVDVNNLKSYKTRAM